MPPIITTTLMAPARRPRHGGRRRLAAMLLAVACLAAAACSSNDKEPLKGERVSILAHEKSVSPDPTAQLDQIRLPPPTVNDDWPTAGGSPNHAMQHLAMTGRPKPAWTADIGTGTASDRPRLPSPVIGDGRIYTMDTEHVVSAFDVADGKRLWTTDLAVAEYDSDSIAGGIAFSDGRIFATTGFAQVVALDAANGTVEWRKEVRAPIHAEPTASGGRVYATTLESKLIAFDAASGDELWTHQAIAETAKLVGGGGPAVDAGVIVAPFSSGELIALRQENGRVLWSDSLAGVRRTDELGALAQIYASPVIDRGGVFAISYGGILAAIDQRSGNRVWEQDFGGLFRPWPAGNFIFQLTKDNDLVCLSRNDGKIYWVTTLPAFENINKKTDPIIWAGPILAGDRLIVVGSNGQALSVSPYSGQILGKEKLDAPMSVPPIVAGETLYFLLNDATLVAYR